MTQTFCNEFLSLLPMLQMHWENELNKIGFILQKADSADRGPCDDATVRMGDGGIGYKNLPKSNSSSDSGWGDRLELKISNSLSV